MPDLFLSYSREDQARARLFASALEQEGFSVWWDQALNPGEAFDEVTEKALEAAKAVIVLWSKTSVGSRWVRAEATQAQSNGRLVPVMIEACKRPIMFELTHTADLSHWQGDRGNPQWRAFVESLARSVGVSDSPAAGARAADPHIPRRAAPKKQMVLVLGVCALLAAGIGGWWLILHREPAARQRVAANSVAASIAVLPFRNMTGQEQMEYFGDGMAEELLNALKGISGVRVSPRTSSFSFKGRDEDIRQIARSLGVETVLEGSVRSAGETIRLTARLADGRTGEQLWSG